MTARQYEGTPLEFVYDSEAPDCAGRHSNDPDLNESNARLIAAAPDMLEALKQAEQQIDYGQIDAAHRIIIAAIDRATGAA